jgi:hypothetical protein
MFVMRSAIAFRSFSDIYALFFDEKGLMAGIGLQGIKGTKIDKHQNGKLE